MVILLLFFFSLLKHLVEDFSQFHRIVDVIPYLFQLLFVAASRNP